MTYSLVEYDPEENSNIDIFEQSLDERKYSVGMIRFSYARNPKFEYEIYTNFQKTVNYETLLSCATFNATTTPLTNMSSLLLGIFNLKESINFFLISETLGILKNDKKIVGFLFNKNGWGFLAIPYEDTTSLKMFLENLSNE